MSPLISIIIPTYNRAHLIGETIVSIQNQTYRNWECIIVDDRSTDHTEQIILGYIKKDERISYYKKPEHLPKGPSAARNYGFTKSKGDFINWFDSDDLMHPKKLETDLKYITSGDFDFTISQSAFFKENGDTKKQYWNKHLYSEDPINDFIQFNIGWGVNTPLWNKNSLERTKLAFDEELMTADDYLYHIQALDLGLKSVVSNQVLVYQREHSGRLNNYRLKSPSKLRVNFYLYLNRHVLELNKEVLMFLNKQYIKQFSNLIKNKEMKIAFIFATKSLLLNYKTKTKIKIIYFFIIGLFYRVFGVGYKRLK